MPRSHDGSRRLPECMRCVLDHLAPGLPPGPQMLLVRYARHAHDPGCGSYPGLRGLSDDLRTSHDTLQKWRDDLWLERRLIDRLPRVAPRGGDLIRLRCDQCQRACMQARCDQCQRANLQHAEPEWSDALQRARMQAQKRRALQMVPAATPVSTGRRPAAPSPNGDGQSGASRRPPNTPSGRRQAADVVSNPSTRQSKQKAGAVLPFKAGRPLPSDHGEPSTPHYAAAPSAATGDPVLHPGRLFEPEPARNPQRWAR